MGPVQEASFNAFGNVLPLIYFWQVIIDIELKVSMLFVVFVGLIGRQQQGTTPSRGDG